MPKDNADKPEVAAHCLGVDVPQSPFLHENRIQRINEARYEGQEIAGALHVVRQGDNVLELGAGIGYVHCYMVHLFETHGAHVLN